MLVLTRHVGESIEIGPVFVQRDGKYVPEMIQIMVTLIDGDKVRIGVDAPLAVPIHRAEIAELIRRIERRVQAWETQEQGTC